MHGREREAEEQHRLHRGRGGELRPEARAGSTRAGRSRSARSRRSSFLHLAKVLFQQYPRRSILGATLMITQSFLYNAIFFTYTLVLTKFYGDRRRRGRRRSSSRSRSATWPGR